MVLRALNFIGPTINDKEAYSMPTGYDLDSGNSPPFSTRWLHNSGTSFMTIDGPGGMGAIGQVTWYLTYWRWDATVTTGDIGNIFGSIHNDAAAPDNIIHLDAIGQSDGSFKLEIRNNNGSPGAIKAGPSTTTFSTGTTYFIILRLDGTDVKVWVDGTEEVTGTFAGVPTDADIGTGTAAHTGRRWACTAVITGGNVGDLDEANDVTEVRYHGPNGDGSLAQYADEDCAGEDASYDNWHDWNSGSHNGGTTFNCGPEDTDKKQTSTIQTATYTHHVLGVIVTSMSALATAQKAVQQDQLMYFSGKTKLHATALATTSFDERRAIFDRTPPGAPWTNARLNASEIGVGRQSADLWPDADEDIHTTAIAAEGLALGTAPSESTIFKVGTSKLGGGDLLEAFP
jgi:hypothetical protein